MDVEREPVLFETSARGSIAVLLVGWLAGVVLLLLSFFSGVSPIFGIIGGVIVVAVPVALGDAGRSYACTATTLRVRWLWREPRSYPLSALSSVDGGTSGSVRVKLQGLATFHLDTRYDDQRALSEHLRSLVHGARPALDEQPGAASRIVLDRLAGLSSEHCLVCGSTHKVAYTPVEAHKGIDLLLFKYVERRRFDFPACRRHRWSRWLLRVAIWHVVPIGTLVGGLLLFDAFGDWLGGWRLGIPLLATVLVLVVLGNGVARWLADSAILGVRLGWLSWDNTTASIAFSDPEVEAKIRAHLAGR